MNKKKSQINFYKLMFSVSLHLPVLSCSVITIYYCNDIILILKSPWQKMFLSSPGNKKLC